MIEWINVEDRLPEHSNRILLLHCCNMPYIGWRKDEDNFDILGFGKFKNTEFVHWAEINLPEQEKK